MKTPAFIQKTITFYREGFRAMSKTSKTLWAIVLVKLFLMFVVLKIFFFPNFLNSKAKTAEEKANYVREQLVETKN